MALPDSANGNDNPDVGSQLDALGSHNNLQESSSNSEEATIMPIPANTPERNLVRVPSRPKSEEPQPDISTIPEELGVNEQVPQTDESTMLEPTGCDRLGMADMVPDGGNNVVPEASNISLPSAAKPSPMEPRTIVLTKKFFKTPKEREVLNAEDERRLQEAKESYQLSLINKLPPSATSARPVDSRNDDHAEVAELSRQSSPIPLDTDAEDASAAARFKSFKRSYERKKRRGETTVEDDVAFSKARNEHDRQTKLKSKKRAYEQIDSEYEDDDPLFLAERTLPASIDYGEPEDDPEVVPAPKRRRGRPNKIPDSALQDATRIGLAALEAESRKSASRKRQPKAPGKDKVPKDPKPRISKSKDKQKANGVPKPKGGRKRKGPEMLNMQTLFNNDIVSAAQANVGKAAQPGFSSTNKKAALAELIASIPESERTTHNADKNALDKATKSFVGHAAMKADGNNGWRLRGMATSLYHYQLLGAAFMRDRENSSTRPYGGLQADEMGLGKTVTCLANIIDGQAPPNSPNRTTLIVCPAGLCSQWLNEIRKHVLPTTFQETIVYRAATGLEWADPIKSLSKMDIIITSYGEVLRSFPYCDPPMHLGSPAAKAKWWTDHFTANRGALHKIFFRRIVLDEAQAIKNHTSKTSIAIRALCGKYRWAISGTPVQNNLQEFFPFFSFLKVPHTGDFETFKNNFGGRNESSDIRLQTLLRQIMIRRTHLDTIFGRPLLQLPGISTNTVEVKFNECEKAIYNIVRNRFIAKIKFYAKSGNLDKQFQSIYVLYLRLRQLTGHILLVQQTLKDLMEGEDLEKLWRLTENEVQPQGEGGSQAVLGQLKKMLAKVKDAPTTPSNEVVHPDSAESLNGSAGATEGADFMGGTFGTAFKFRKYLRTLQESGKWDEVNKRSLCHKCRGLPDNPHITSCFHVYCKECLEAVLFDAAKEGKAQANCLACDAQFEHTEACQGFNQAATNLHSPTIGGQARRARKSSDSDETDIDWITVSGSILPSAKTLAVKAQIQNWVEEDPGAKIIIFTQFRDMIRILTRVMNEEQWGCAQFHGGMSFVARDKALVEFAEKPEIKVLLASLKAGGVGLNLTMASKVIIVDLWWNESVESQAFCRCFRIGQDRPVDICRIVVKDSIDDDILIMQVRKTTEIDMAMAAKNRPGKLTTRQLLRLFGPINWDEGNEGDPIADPFILVEDDADDDDQSDSGAPTRAPAPPFELS